MSLPHLHMGGDIQAGFLWSHHKGCSSVLVVLIMAGSFFYYLSYGTKDNELYKVLGALFIALFTINFGGMLSSS